MKLSQNECLVVSVVTNTLTIEVPDGPDPMSLAIDLYLVRLHHLLNGLPYVT